MSTRYFLALDGVNGDSLNSTYKGWFEVSGFDIDLAGAGASMAAFSPLTLTLNSSTGLAPLLALAASGDHLNGGRGRSPNPTQSMANVVNHDPRRSCSGHISLRVEIELRAGNISTDTPCPCHVMPTRTEFP